MMKDMQKTTGQQEYVDIIDEDEKVIDTVPRQEAVKKDMLRKGVIIYVFNTEGELLIHKRSMQKRAYPGVWDTAVCGAVSAGESAEQGAKRELAEEMGYDTELQFLFKTRYHKAIHNNIHHIFKTIVEKEPVIDKTEVERYEWVRPEKVRKMMKERQFTVPALDDLEKFGEKVLGKQE